jgi:hypothetical protein
VGTISSVGVAEAGNQTIVGVGVAVSAGRGVAVDRVEPSGRQATERKSPYNRRRMRAGFIKE